MYSSIPGHRRTDTVSPKLLRWLSTGQRGGSRTGCPVSEQPDSEEVEPDHPLPGGDLLILAIYIGLGLGWYVSMTIRYNATRYCEATSYGRSQHNTLESASASDTWHVPTAVMALVRWSIRLQVACTQCGTWGSSPTV